MFCIFSFLSISQTNFSDSKHCFVQMVMNTLELGTFYIGCNLLSQIITYYTGNQNVTI